MNIDFEGQTALVTGATRGIGARIANDLEERGASVVGTGTAPDQISKLNDRAAAEDRDRRWLCADFSDDESLDSFLEELRDLDRVDVCINNAGINRTAPIQDTDVDDFEDLLSVNLRAPFRIVRALGGKMKQQGYGRIVNIGSIFGVISRAERSMYSTTKFGIRGLTVGASNDLAPHGVLVNTVSPGFVLTDLTRKVLSQQQMDELEEEVPAGRLAEPEDISRTVLFLASEENSYITGQNIVADGGYVNV